MRKLKLTQLNLVFCMFSTFIAAESKDDFAYQMLVTPTDSSSLQQVVLTEEIYRYSKLPNLGDVRVFDQQGNPIAFEISDVDVTKDQYQQLSTVVYPLYKSEDLAEKTEDTVLLYNQLQQLNQIKSTKTTPSENIIVGYVVDLGEPKFGGDISLDYDISPVEETSFLHFRIDQSNDLKRWSRLASDEVLAQLIHYKRGALHNRSSLVGVHSRYLRLTVKDAKPKFNITAIRQSILVKQIQPQVLESQSIFRFDEQTESFVAHINSSMSLNFVRLNLEATPKYVSGTLLFKKNSADKSWNYSSDIFWYQLRDGTTTLINNQAELNGLRAEELSIKLNSVEKAHDFTLGWNAQKLIFLASGESPYTLVVGNKNTAPQSRAQQQIVSKIKSQLKTPIADASVGESSLTPIKPPSVFDELNWSRIVLWLILILSVVLMLWMARGILKKIDKAK